MPLSSLAGIFSFLPQELKEALLESFNSVRRNYTEQRWEPSELNGGKFCEAVFRVLEWYTTNPDSVYTPMGSQIGNFGVAVRRFENSTTMPDAIRFHLPNALIFLYTVRNKRGVGHLGKDINPNRMDAEVVVGVTNWVMAETIRLLHSIDIDDAQKIIEGIVEKRNALVWEVADVRRILNPALQHKDRCLVLLHSTHPEPVLEATLFQWCEHSNTTNFRKQILQELHKERLIEYDPAKRLVYLSPLGVADAEKLLASYTG